MVDISIATSELINRQSQLRGSPNCDVKTRHDSGLHPRFHQLKLCSQVLSTCALTVLVPELLTSGLLAYTIGPLGVGWGALRKLVMSTGMKNWISC